MKLGTNRNTIDLEVADKIFTIAIFPIICEYLIVENDTIEVEFAKLKEPTVEQLKEKFEKQIKTQFEILENLLVSNGYEYDQKWWESHADAQLINEFIVNSKLKDYSKSKKKVVKLEA